jgi:hypothetical protein
MKVTEFLDDETIYASIINSKRRIEELKLERLDLSSPNCMKLQMIIENIGPRIKRLSVIDCKLSMAEIALLNSMPQLEYIQLWSVQTKNISSLHNFRLNLSELKTLYVFKSCEELLEVFDHLPDDVLRKVKFRLIKAESPRIYLVNQRMLKSVKITSCSFVPLNIDQLNLEELKTNSISEELKLILQKQASLKSLSLDSIGSQNDFNFICSHLHSLDQFKCYLNADNIDFSELANLMQLKTFEICLDNEVALRSIKSCSVETLKIDLGMEIVDEETVITLAANCPNVVNLNIDLGNEEDAINWSLKNFPSLETFSCSFINKEYVFPYNLTHHNLKKLEIREFELSINLLFLFSRLENLEFFKIETAIDWQGLQIILSAPKLEALCLKQFPVVDREFIRIMKNYGKNLESFHVLHGVGATVNFNLSSEELREEFKDQFPIFSYRAGNKWTMKKRNKPKNCCNK